MTAGMSDQGLTSPSSGMPMATPTAPQDERNTIELATAWVGLVTSFAAIIVLGGYTLQVMGQYGDDFGLRIRILVTLTSVPPLAALVASGLLASGRAAAGVRSVGHMLAVLAGLACALVGVIGVFANLSEFGTDEVNRVSSMDNTALFGAILTSGFWVLIGLAAAALSGYAVARAARITVVRTA